MSPGLRLPAEIFPYKSKFSLIGPYLFKFNCINIKRFAAVIVMDNFVLDTGSQDIIIKGFNFRKTQTSSLHYFDAGFDKIHSFKSQSIHLFEILFATRDF